LLWYYARPSLLQTVISVTTTLAGSPPYQCTGLGAYSAPSATISRATLEAGFDGASGCADLLVAQSSPGAPALNPGKDQDDAGWEISVNLGASNPVFTDAALCPDGGTACARPFVYVSPFATEVRTFGTYDGVTCPPRGIGASCPVTPRVARSVDGLKVSYNNFNFPTYDACVADLRITCTDAVLEALGPPADGSSVLQPMPYLRKGYQAGFNGTYRLKRCTSVSGTSGGAGQLSFNSTSTMRSS
jgi:hypothetical protein